MKELIASKCPGFLLLNLLKVCKCDGECGREMYSFSKIPPFQMSILFKQNFLLFVQIANEINTKFWNVRLSKELSKNNRVL